MIIDTIQFSRITFSLRGSLILFGVAALGALLTPTIQAEESAPQVQHKTNVQGNYEFHTLTSDGGDRATAYVMSNKIVRRKDDYLVTWIDSHRVNHWALVDKTTGKISSEGTVGDARRDNHCGAALAKGTDGTMHIVLGGHFSSLSHYYLPPGEEDWKLAEDGEFIGKTGHGKAPTYPSLVCDDEGTLHLTYRSEPGARNAALCYCKRASNGKWTTPVTLVQNVIKEHSWMHNAVQDGKDGTLHVLATITLPYAPLGEDARYYGAAHLYSNDHGETWKQYGANASLTLPVLADQLQRIEGSKMSANRTSPTHEGKGGPWHPYVFRMMLSNISLDSAGHPRVVMGNLMEGSAKLWSHTPQKSWVAQELRGYLDQLTEGTERPRYRIQHLASLARLEGGRLMAVLMVSPIASTGWGADYTRLVRLEFNKDLTLDSIKWVAQSNSCDADWIPSLEFYNHRDPYDSPALLFTRGRNAGGYSNNVNNVKTKVIFALPSN